MVGHLFIVSGPSGAGKSSLCSALLEEMCPDLQLSISCTTRQPRPGEKDGCEYRFLSKSDFESQIEQGAFLEWANVHGNMYGTRLSDVESMLDSGKSVLLEIDWQGAAQVATKLPTAKRIFILPPSIDELRYRLTGRGQDDPAVIEKRVQAAQAEMNHAHEAHHQIVNDNFDDALLNLINFCQK
ncbi:MAG: guanylate kinase [Mariprofundaceae bacterium]